MSSYSCNTKQKLYPDGFVKQISCSYPIFNLREKEEKDYYGEFMEYVENAWGGYDKLLKLEAVGFLKPGEIQEIYDAWLAEKKRKPQNKDNETRDDSMKRAKEKIFDIAAVNDFDYFITWTLDPGKIDRYDPKEISKKLKRYLSDCVKRKNAKYLIIPELHKDGAIHLHGLLSGDFVMVDSGVRDKKDHVIYNMPQWKLGWSTAIELYGDKLNCARYITKYVNKDFRKIFGNFYYSGGGVVRSPTTIYSNLDYDKIDTPEYREVYGYKYVGFDLMDDDLSDTDFVQTSGREEEK